MTMTMMTMTMRYATTTIYTLLAFSLASSSPLVVYAAPNANANFNADVGKTLLEVLSAPIVWSDVVGAGLVTRQDTTTPNTPAACVAVCDPINPIVSAGCTPSTCCTDSFFRGFFNCFECALADAGGTDYTEIQERLDLIYNSCTARGLTVPRLTFPGQPTSRSLSALPSTVTTPSPLTTKQSVITQLTTTSGAGAPLTTISDTRVAPPPPQTQTAAGKPSDTPSSGVKSPSLFGGRLTGGSAVVLMASVWGAGLVVGGML